mmetsp:Transcript_6394/g.7803  ORF Transcript_6394/g.7803 Transcript_6394/m.7803 type:complete len:311 (+) Transcript_6394:423-1355(+)
MPAQLKPPHRKPATTTARICSCDKWRRSMTNIARNGRPMTTTLPQLNKRQDTTHHRPPAPVVAAAVAALDQRTMHSSEGARRPPPQRVLTGKTAVVVGAECHQLRRLPTQEDLPPPPPPSRPHSSSHHRHLILQEAELAALTPLPRKSKDMEVGRKPRERPAAILSQPKPQRGGGTRNRHRHHHRHHLHPPPLPPPPLRQHHLHRRRARELRLRAAVAIVMCARSVKSTHSSVPLAASSSPAAVAAAWVMMHAQRSARRSTPTAPFQRESARRRAVTKHRRYVGAVAWKTIVRGRSRRLSCFPALIDFIP